MGAKTINISAGKNHITGPLPKGSPKRLTLLPVLSEDYDAIEALAQDWGVELEEVVAKLLVMEVE